MRFHASCAARPSPNGFHGVLLRGPPGSGKSDFLLRLLARGFQLVADDQVLVNAGIASPPAALAGLIELRGLGLFRRPFLGAAPLVLIVELGIATARLPEPVIDAVLHLPVVTIDPAAASAVDRLIMALDCATGLVENIAGAFTA